MFSRNYAKSNNNVVVSVTSNGSSSDVSIKDLSNRSIVLVENDSNSEGHHNSVQEKEVLEDDNEVVDNSESTRYNTFSRDPDNSPGENNAVLSTLPDGSKLTANNVSVTSKPTTIAPENTISPVLSISKSSGMSQHDEDNEGFVNIPDETRISNNSVALTSKNTDVMQENAVSRVQDSQQDEKNEGFLALPDGNRISANNVSEITKHTAVAQESAVLPAETASKYSNVSRVQETRPGDVKENFTILQDERRISTGKVSMASQHTTVATENAASHLQTPSKYSNVSRTQDTQQYEEKEELTNLRDGSSVSDNKGSVTSKHTTVARDNATSNLQTASKNSNMSRGQGTQQYEDNQEFTTLPDGIRVSANEVSRTSKRTSNAPENAVPHLQTDSKYSNMSRGQGTQQHVDNEEFTTLPDGSRVSANEVYMTSKHTTNVPENAVSNLQSASKYSNMSRGQVTQQHEDNQKFTALPDGSMVSANKASEPKNPFSNVQSTTTYSALSHERGGQQDTFAAVPGGTKGSASNVYIGSKYSNDVPDYNEDSAGSISKYSQQSRAAINDDDFRINSSTEEQNGSIHTGDQSKHTANMQNYQQQQGSYHTQASNIQGSVLNSVNKNLYNTETDGENHEFIPFYYEQTPKPTQSIHEFNVMSKNRHDYSMSVHNQDLAPSFNIGVKRLSQKHSGENNGPSILTTGGDNMHSINGSQSLANVTSRDTGNEPITELQYNNIDTHNSHRSRSKIIHNAGCEHYRCWMVILMIAAVSFIIGHLLHDVIKSLIFSDSYSCMLD